jgi:hypothetical protein
LKKTLCSLASHAHTTTRGGDGAVTSILEHGDDAERS